MRAPVVLASLCLVLVVLCLQRPSPAAGPPSGTKPGAPAGTKPKTLLLTDRRSYHFDVQKIDARVYVTVEKEWTFSKAFPPALLSSARKHPNRKPLEERLLREAGGSKAEGGYIRWKPDKKRRHFAGALLWYVHGPKQKALGVSVDVVLDHQVGAGRSLAMDFSPLQLTLDLHAARLLAVRFAKTKLPDHSQTSSSVTVHDTVDVDFTGRLTGRSSQAVHLADELLSGSVLQKLNLLGLNELRNESHHGITLGWLGLEHLQHNLFFLLGKPNEPIAFRYRVSGKSFPLQVVRRQLEQSGWPLVLAGYEYLGTSPAGVRVYRPVEYVLSRQSSGKAATTQKKRNGS